MSNPQKPVRETSSRATKNKNRFPVRSSHPPKPVKKTPSRAGKKEAQSIVSQKQKQNADKRRDVITFAAMALVIAIVVGVAFYMVVIMPMQRTILTVGNANIGTSYLLKRVVANPGGDISSTVQQLTAEMIIKQQSAANGVAPVTEQAIDTYLRDKAKGTNETITDAEYNKWFDAQLVNTGLSAKEYREVVGRDIQRERLTDILSVNIPSVAPQVHLWGMIFGSQDAALAAKAKVDGGSDFATVATAAGQTNHGDKGWMPLGVVDAQLQAAAAKLEIGKCSDPVSYVQTTSGASSGTVTNYVLLMVSEKSDAMQVTDAQMNTLKNKALLDWLNTQASTAKITFHGLHGSTTLDTQTLTWLNNQVQKLVNKRRSTQTNYNRRHSSEDSFSSDNFADYHRSE